MLGGDFLGDMFRSVMGAAVLWMGIVTVRFMLELEYVVLGRC